MPRKRPTKKQQRKLDALRARQSGGEPLSDKDVAVARKTRPGSQLGIPQPVRSRRVAGLQGPIPPGARRALGQQVSGNLGTMSQRDLQQLKELLRRERDARQKGSRPLGHLKRQGGFPRRDDNSSTDISQLRF